MSLLIRRTAPAFSIGLASCLVALDAQWRRLGDPTCRALFDDRKKIFAVAFGMGRRVGRRDVLPVRHQLVAVLIKLVL